MKKKSKSKILLLIIALFGILGIWSSISATDDSGKIILTKTATKVSDNFDETNPEYGRLANVTLTVGGNPYTTQTSTMSKLDIILVLDSSGSMRWTDDGQETTIDSERRITSLKTNATNFVNNMIDTEGNVKIGLVEYDTTVKQTVALTSTKKTLTDAISRMSQGGGTNLQSGINAANSLLTNGGRSNAKKIVIILTDGVPTRFSYTKYGYTYSCGNGQDDSVSYSDDSACPNKKPSEVAKEALDSLKTTHAKADVYTITFGNESEAATILATVNPATAADAAPLYKNTAALSAADLKKEFETISNSTKNIIATGAVVTDVIPAEFKLTDAAKTALTEQGVKYVENQDGTTTITWTVGNVEAGTGKEKSLSYDVIAKDEYHGSIYTNETSNYESATLTATIPEENPYAEYTTDTVTLKFEAPTADIPAITNNDHYNDNPSYIGVAESTIVGTSILTNDLNKNLHTDKENALETLTVTDEIVIEETDNVIKKADGVYEINSNGKLLGTLSITSDGKFTFSSEENVEGDVSFDYHIKTTITRNGTTSYVYSNTSTVTLKITPREKINITGTKVWNDANNQDGIRPDSITVVLKANEEKQAETTITSANWNFEFNNLYKYEINHEGEEQYEIKYTVEEKTNVPGYKTKVEGTTITNTHTPETTTIEGTKVWDDANNQDGIRPTSITIRLLANGKEVKVTTATEASNWKYSFTDLPKYEDGQEISYTVIEDEVAGYETTIEKTTITNTHTPETTTIEGTKVWDDADNQDGIRPTEITINLLANGVKVASKKVTGDSNWTYEFKDVAKYENGQEIVYIVTEDEVTGYKTKIDGKTITNTHTPATTTIEGTKVWDDADNQDGIRPTSITINLLANGSLIDSKTITSESNWTYEFTDLPKYKDGKEITYTVTENKVSGYETTIENTTITNTHIPETIKVSGTKTWNDNNNQDGKRPSSITVNLLADGTLIASAFVTEDKDWTYEFINLPKYKNGKEIVYTITENEVAEYTTTISGYNITNTHEIEKIKVSGTKTWNDANNQDGKRPSSITIRLFANGKEVSVKTVTETTSWTYEFTNLPKYENGKEIVYTISEDKVAEYTTTISGHNITNTHEPEKVKISGTKVWDDANNQDGIRPEKITINLYANGKKVNTTTATKEKNWTYEFTNLPKYENGQEITYSISEESVEGYTTTIENTTITNTHKPETIKVTGTKVWDDANNQDGIRPTSITVRLYANNKEVKSIQVTSQTNWTYEFTDLPKYENGQEISYTVSEDKVTGYETKVEKTTITNTHTPETIDLSGTKTWIDNNNQDGKRPASITVILLANGKEVAKTSATALTNWTYEFKKVPKYENGQEIVYTVSEVTVTDYTTKVDGMNITNTHTPESTEVSGTKIWNDANNQDGIRPTSIIVNLYADGTFVKSATVTNNTNWAYTFSDLPRYKNGQEIKYTVTENEVLNYKASISGYNITNTYVPATTTVTGTKIWNDRSNQDGIRPTSITVNLLADGTFVKSTTATIDTNWTYTFENLPKYRDGGIEIVYTVTETAVSGYETTINGYEITNTHTPGTTEVSGTKTWNDGSNQDGIRPTSITVSLLANGEVLETKNVTEAEGWTYTFANLPEYKEGQKIVYSIEETTVPGYETSIDGFNIKNTHIPELISVSGTKTWLDADNQDGMRPESITVRLLANGEEVTSKVVTATTNWTYTFENVPKYSAGAEITYTVVEDAVEGYVGTVDGMNITNEHTPITITINGEKVWIDEENIEGLRPTLITVRLLANGEEVASTEVTADTNWKYTFENLPQYAAGQEINYTVVEDAVEHYETSYDKDNKFIIVNTHDPKDITISGTKTWIDADNRYERPESITVTLTGKIGEKVVVEETLEVTSETNWTYTFNNLPEYREGMLIVYTIDEADVKDYDKSINGYDITNTYNPETIDISGTKVWDDADNQDGLRPESITINLLANGEKVATTQATAENNWTYEFKEQVVYASGVEIEYTVEEISVDGYTTAIEGFDVTNHHTPETVSYTVSKVWNDQNNNDRIRPESITVRLLADGQEILSQIIGEETEWTYSFTDLPKYRDQGIAIKYEIVEDEVKGYTTSIEQSVSETDTNNTNVIITNTHENEKNDITINKVWDDTNNEQNARPESITVTITGKVNNEVVVTETVEITEEMDWTYTTENHDKYLNGEEIIYEIEEQEVEGYITFYDGYQITNAYKATGQIMPPNTNVTPSNLPVETIVIDNITNIESTKPSDILTLMLVMLSTITMTTNSIIKYRKNQKSVI